MTLRKPKLVEAGRCRCCGCTEADCTKCVERTGVPCERADSRTDALQCLGRARCGQKAEGRVVYIRERIAGTAALYTQKVTQWVRPVPQGLRRQVPQGLLMLRLSLRLVAALVFLGCLTWLFLIAVILRFCSRKRD